MNLPTPPPPFPPPHTHTHTTPLLGYFDVKVSGGKHVLFCANWMAFLREKPPHSVPSPQHRLTGVIVSSRSRICHMAIEVSERITHVCCRISRLPKSLWVVGSVTWLS